LRKISARVCGSEQICSKRLMTRDLWSGAELGESRISKKMLVMKTSISDLRLSLKWRMMGTKRRRDRETTLVTLEVQFLRRETQR